MNTPADHTADYKALSLLTGALIGGIVLFGLIALLIHLVSGAFIVDSQVENTLVAALLVIGSLVVIGARMVYNRRINRLKEANQSAREKFELFRAITITHMALCELPAILGLALFICFGHFLFFLPAAMSAVEMIKKFPTQHRIQSVVNSGTF